MKKQYLYLILALCLLACSNNFTTPAENEVIKLVNGERRKKSLSTLTTTKELSEAANKRAKEIAISFSHTRPNGTSCFTVFQEYNIQSSYSGENIAAGQKTPESVMNSWMNSPGHRANILNGNFNKIGVGEYEKDGTHYWVQLFAKF